MATKKERALRRELSSVKRRLEEVSEATRRFLGLAEDRYAMLGRVSRRWRALARRYRDELVTTRARVHALNLLVRRLSVESVSPEEAAELHRQIAALVAEVGTLRSELREY